MTTFFFTPMSDDPFTINELCMHMRGFYRNGALFLSDSLVERRLLPVLRDVKGVIDAAVFGLAGSVRLMVSYSGPKAALETMFSFQPERIVWKKGEHRIGFRVTVAGDGEVPEGLAEGFAGLLSLLFIESACVTAGIGSFQKPVRIPRDAITQDKDLLTVFLDAIPEARDRFAFRPLKDKLVFNVVNGVDVNELTLDDLFTLNKISFDHTGADLSWKLSEQVHSVKKEMQEALTKLDKPVESLFAF
ncbi:MAG: hypothetical protein WA705_11405 [Candidatus Ozemobacteraceae bacterium]